MPLGINHTFMKYFQLIFLVCCLALYATSCTKDTAKAAFPIITPIPKKDTTIVLKISDTVPVRVSFDTGRYLDFTFMSNIREGRCPTCVNGLTDTCPHASWADVNFQIKNELGQTYNYSPSFYSCVIQYDTSNYLFHYIPFHQNYGIYPLKLAPYPTDLNHVDWGAYTLTIYVKQL